MADKLNLGSVRADEVLTLAALRERFGWKEDSVRTARQAGLVLIRLGSQKFALGEDVIQFFRELRDRQSGVGDGT